VVSNGQNPVDSARYLYSESRQAIYEGDFFRAEFLLEKIFEKEYSLSDYNQALLRNMLGYVYY